MVTARGHAGAISGSVFHEIAGLDTVRGATDTPLPRQSRHARLTALGQMLIVTVLWSSSFPIHKALMNEGMPPLSLAGYRYFSASLLLLLVFVLTTRKERSSASATRRPELSHWIIMLGIGFFTYTAQGVHLTALSLISASDSGLVSMTWLPVGVAILASLIERTPPARAQLGGLGILLVGIYLYFPHTLHGARLMGIGLNVLSSSMWAVAAIMTHIAMTRMKMTSLRLTAISMLSGSSLLLCIALVHDRFYVPDLHEVLWLAFLVVVNTSFAFVLYNHTMKILGAFEVAAMQDSMVIQIGILSTLLLGEVISPIMALGMLLVVMGVAVIQYWAPQR